MTNPFMLRSTHKRLLQEVSKEAADTELRRKFLAFIGELESYALNAFITPVSAQNMLYVVRRMKELAND